MRHLPATFLALLLANPALHAADIGVDHLEQKAWQAALESAAQSVVQIQTIGGLDRVGKTLLSQGPTTGLIVSTDGYIVSSVYNFAGQPNSILVRLASGEQVPAELVARDKNRLLVLLKIDSDTPLPVPETLNENQIHVGQWSVALGRTFRNDAVNVSVGIISGLNRRYGRVMQTDASISIANYGGPLIDIHGRTLGILVPMTPQGVGGANSQELAGAEFYDSGIGFAVPLTHVFSILERWKLGEDLLPGKLGVGLVEGPAAIAPPKITIVWPGSPAAEAGWKADDLVIAINGHPVTTQGQLRFQIAPRYAGDSLSITIRRGDKELESELTLAGEMDAYRHAFLGVLPDRSNESRESPGVSVQTVWPSSPAAKAGLQVNDVLMEVNQQELKSLKHAIEVMAALQPKQPVKLLVQRNETELTLTAELSELPTEIPSAEQLSLPQDDTEDENTQELQTLKLTEFPQEAKFYSPDSKSEQSTGFLLWLGKSSEEHDQQILNDWQEICRRDQIVLLIAHPASETGWTSDDLEYLKRLQHTARNRWHLNPQRTIVGGVEKAGQLAFALAFALRKEFSGAIGIDAPLPRSMQIPSNRPGSRLAILAVESQGSTFAPIVRNDLQRLEKSGYPASWLQSSAREDNQSPLEASIVESIRRWIHGLDRL